MRSYLREQPCGVPMVLILPRDGSWRWKCKKESCITICLRSIKISATVMQMAAIVLPALFPNREAHAGVWSFYMSAANLFVELYNKGRLRAIPLRIKGK